MPSKQQSTGMRGVFLVAAELAGLGFIVSPTSRSAAGADLLVTDDACGNAFSVQVKSNGKPANFWLVGERAQHVISPTHIYVFVNIHADGKHEYYVVPSSFVAERAKSVERPHSTWHAFFKRDATPYRDGWAVFGKSRISLA